jgi:hypothetical protein
MFPSVTVALSSGALIVLTDLSEAGIGKIHCCVSKDRKETAWLKASIWKFGRILRGFTKGRL